MSFSSQFIEIMDYILQKVGIIVDWTSQNVIPYMMDLGQRFVYLSIAESILWIVAWLFILFVATKVKASSFKQYGVITVREAFSIISEAPGFFFIMQCIAFVITIIVTLTQLFNVLGCIIMPERTILELLMSIANQIG